MSLIRTGRVSSVDVKSRTARVIFPDKADMVSAPLTVLRNSPLITVDIITGNQKWEVDEEYASAPRELGLDEKYTKNPTDKISGKLESSGHNAEIEVHGWLPYIGQTVLCILLQNGEGDGYIIGGV